MKMAGALSLQAAKQEAEEKQDAAQKPLVVIVEGVEGVDPLLLQDLILVLSEVGDCCLLLLRSALHFTPNPAFAVVP